MDFSAAPEVLTFAILGNVFNLAYNIPFVYLVWKNRSSKNISGLFLILRFCGSLSWLVYGIIIKDVWILSSNIITLIATIMICYIKILDKINKIETTITQI
jgi:uncharacterized protein with PQ loop repeat